MSREGRPIWKTIPIRLGVTLITMVLPHGQRRLPWSSPAGSPARPGKILGLGSSAVTIFGIAKWPVLLLVVSLILAILYYAAPNVKQPGMSAGSVRAVSPQSSCGLPPPRLFAVYVASFSSYNKTYGALGGVVAFLVWLWITNVVILLGAELNAELERSRQIHAGQPPDQEPYLPPRDEPKT